MEVTSHSVVLRENFFKQGDDNKLHVGSTDLKGQPYTETDFWHIRT